MFSTATTGRLLLRPTAEPGSAGVHHLPGGVCRLRIIAIGGSLEVKNFARLRSLALSEPSSAECSMGLIQSELPVIKLRENDLRPEEEDDEDDEFIELDGGREIAQKVEEVKAMLRRIGDGEISISAYDTAWVAMVKSCDGSGGPQFPSSLRWIADNQLPDGSWGDADILSAHDRMINTLACVVALKSWKLHPGKCRGGLTFICENMSRLGEEEAELMPIGFEVAFPSLVDIAKSLELDIPYDDPALQVIYAKRNLKLERIPKDVMHQAPTTLLHSLEGMPGLDWERLLRLQSSDGSFLFSPSSTAYALMQTGDENCLEYLRRVVHRFGGGVPNVYPVDLFEHLWAVDRLQRLGISRYFEREIRDCLDYVYKHWSEDGICWAKNSSVRDLDDTAMGFRLLRLHGYAVSAGVFRLFEKEGEFFCFAGQSNQAVTGMYNLNRAAQVGYRGEEVLERAGRFSDGFLRGKRAAGQLVDKWIITKDLAGEVEYAMEFPWCASLPRVETRTYLEQYGGGGDVWIGKTLYRMPLVNSDIYLDLAKLDFKQCQALHQLEWFDLQEWFKKVGLLKYGVKRINLMKAYFLATACIFEPDRAIERLGWARTIVMAEVVSTYFDQHQSCSDAMRQRLIAYFLGSNQDEWNADHRLRPMKRQHRQAGEAKELAVVLRRFIHRLASEVRLVHQQREARRHLKQAWKEWLRSQNETGLLIVRTIEICAGRFDSTGLIMAHAGYDQLARHLVSLVQILQMEEDEEEGRASMQELANCALEGSDGLNQQTKQTFLMVAKSFYYAAHCSPSALNTHISKVFFNPLD